MLSIELTIIIKLLFNEFLCFRSLIKFSMNVIEFRLFVENNFDLNKFSILVQRLFCL